MTRQQMKWVFDMKNNPKLVAEALFYFGCEEISGEKSNPLILSWAKKLGVEGIYTNDDVAWCALFICYLCKVTGKPMPFTGFDCLRAKSFERWGNNVDVKDIMYGDILVFQRPKGFHVAICIAETKTSYIVLGGNQSNSVTFAEIKKDRLYSARRYYATAPPSSVKKYVVDSSGILSSNEL